MQKIGNGNGRKVEHFLAILTGVGFFLLLFFLAFPVLRGQIFWISVFSALTAIPGLTLVGLEVWKLWQRRNLDVSDTSFLKAERQIVPPPAQGYVAPSTYVGSGVETITVESFPRIASASGGTLNSRRQQSLSCGFARVVDSKGSLVREGYIYTIYLTLVARGKDRYMSAKWVPYSPSGEERQPSEDLGRVEKIFFVPMFPQQIDSGEMPTFFREGRGI